MSYTSSGHQGAIDVLGFTFSATMGYQSRYDTNYDATTELTNLKWCLKQTGIRLGVDYYKSMI